MSAHVKDRDLDDAIGDVHDRASDTLAYAAIIGLSAAAGPACVDLMGRDLSAGAWATVVVLLTIALAMGIIGWLTELRAPQIARAELEAADPTAAFESAPER